MHSSLHAKCAWKLIDMSTVSKLRKVALSRRINLFWLALQVLLLWTLWIWHPLGFSTEALAHWGQHFPQPSQVRLPSSCFPFSSNSNLVFIPTSHASICPAPLPLTWMSSLLLPQKCSTWRATIFQTGAATHKLSTMLNSCVRMRLKEQKEALEQMGYKDMARCCH